MLSQYKREVAAKYRINLKPVILFKAQKTIAQSQQNKANFHRLIERLSAKEIENIRLKSNIDIVRRAFAFFDAQGVSSAQLAERLKREFRVLPFGQRRNRKGKVSDTRQHAGR
ncbi:hypothetical protein [Roseiflexus castenholzii]|jgi:type III restriction enzyme|uniref:hypothetical protein n=1 Tax=Roseiflexus castenholzii TaxID=120962 RepID=UPI000300C18A|nr:hypothetical protein [Roseiflexus castenholzii]